MKGREIIYHAVRAKMPDREQVRENCLRQTVSEKRTVKRPVLRRSVFTAAMAAVLIMCIMFGAMLINPKSDNIFTLNAYAMEQMTDGSIGLRKVDLLNETYYWSTYNDGSVFYVNANLKCEGENIKYVEFYADNGFFAKQYLKIENGKIITEAGVPASYRKAPGDDDYTLVMYGEDFDVIGESFTLDKDALTDDFLLFVGTEVSDWREYPSQMIIRAVATFNDGKTQEETITLDLAKAENGMGIRKLPPEEIEKQKAELEKYNIILHSISLEQCEIIPDSVKNLTYGNIFEYSYGNNKKSVDVTMFFPITEESIDSAINQGLFDENGIFIQGSNLYDLFEEYDGSDGYIAVIKNNGDGTFTGMVYKVPGWLILESMK